MELRELQKIIHAYAREKGWWDGPERPVGDQFVNFHAEISEAWEEWRNGHTMDDIYLKDGKPEGVPIELADCVIRILDTCEKYGINLEDAIMCKHKYNMTRPYRHGGKKA